jgi:TPR repeat protein
MTESDQLAAEAASLEPADPARAALTQRAAALGHLRSIGTCLFHGWGHAAPDPAAALPYFARAADECGDALAMRNLGNCHFAGQGVDGRSLGEALRWFARGADTGDAECMYSAGFCVEEAVDDGLIDELADTLGDKVEEKNQQDGKSSSTSSSSTTSTITTTTTANASSDSVVTLGGRTTPADAMARAVAFYDRAAALGHSEAALALAHCVVRGRGVAAPDLARATVLYRRVAEGVDASPEAMLFLAACLHRAAGTAEEGDTWIARAVEQLAGDGGDGDGDGDAEDLTTVAEACEKVAAIENPDLALRFWTLAAEAGDTDAMLRLAVRLLARSSIETAGEQPAGRAAGASGLGQSGNDVDANANADASGSGDQSNLTPANRPAPADPVAWLTRAADAGSIEAMVRLALQLLPAAADSAEPWLARALRESTADEKFQIGAAFESGRGLPHDLARAEAWLGAACEAGHRRAAFGLGNVHMRAGRPREAVRCWAAVVHRRDNDAAADDDDDDNDDDDDQPRDSDDNDERLRTVGSAWFNLATALVTGAGSKQDNSTGEEDKVESGGGGGEGAGPAQAAADHRIGPDIVRGAMWLHRAEACGAPRARQALAKLDDDTRSEALRRFRETDCDADLGAYLAQLFESSD